MNALLFIVGLIMASPASADEGQEASSQPSVRELTQEEQSAISRNVSLVQAQMGTLSHVDFKFSEASIKWIDGFIERNRSRPSTSTLEQVIASYLGETIRVNFHCAWVGIDEGIGLNCPGDLMLFPFSKVSKQFQSGHEHSIYAFYREIPKLIASARAGLEPADE
jgi:hypothetical protein